MGKTKTAFIGADLQDTKSGKEAYEEKRRKKAAIQKAQGSEIKETKDSLNETATEDKKVVKKEVNARGKKYTQAKNKIDKTKLYAVSEAVELVKKVNFAKFDASIELHITTKKEVNTKIVLPHMAGKSKIIEVANDKTIEKLKQGKIDFDVLLATPEYMVKIVPFAKLLGPKGMMPNPKNGTLIKTEKDAKNFATNATVLKTQKDAFLIHVVVGKISQKDDEVINNIEAILGILAKQIERVFICSSMSPSIKLVI